METLIVPVKKLQAGNGNGEKSAQLASLIYVSPTEPGILRKKRGKGFTYYYQNRQITDAAELDRIKKLVIPPAWRDVWICRHHEGHLQVTGLDSKNRKQYRYHPLWSGLRNQTKYYRLYEFGKVLPKIRRQVKRDLRRKVFDRRSVLALLVSIMDETGIRIGSESYEKQNGSFGLTTLKDHHVTFHGGHTMEFTFKGKRGITHKISLRNKRLAKMVRKCRDIPGKELFQYYDETGVHRSIGSGDVNSYLQEITGENFTAKDFRTWVGSVYALSYLNKTILPESQAEIKKQLTETISYVAKQLGNTATVCKKYYIHPVIIDSYSGNRLVVDSAYSSNGILLSREELALIQMLKMSLHKKVKIA